MLTRSPSSGRWIHRLQWSCLARRAPSRSLIWARIPTRCTAHHCILPLPHPPSRTASVSTLHVAEPAGQYHSLRCSGRPFLITNTLKRCMTSCASLTGASPSRSVFPTPLGGFEALLMPDLHLFLEDCVKGHLYGLSTPLMRLVCLRTPHKPVFGAALHEPDWAHIHVSTEVSVILQ